MKRQRAPYQTYEQQQEEFRKFYSKPPVLSKDKKTYCAPWCGAGCTKAAYDRAVQKAGELADYLGKGWKPNVWENMGWFYEVSNGIINVTPSDQRKDNGEFGARFTVDVLHDGVNGVPQFSATYHDPRIAVEQAVARFDAYIKTIQQARSEIVINWKR